MKANFLKRKIVVLTLTMFLLVSLFFPNPVRAQITDFANLAERIAEWVSDTAMTINEWAGDTVAAVAYRNAINLYLGEMAKETAEWFATGGEGKKPMFKTDPDYWNKLGDQALGGMINKLAESATGFNDVNLCDPIDPTIKFKILVGFDPKYQEMSFDPQESCSWTIIKERAGELAKEKIFEFDIELKEGKAAVFRGELGDEINHIFSRNSENKKILGDFWNVVEKNITEIELHNQRLKEYIEQKKNYTVGELSQRKIELQNEINILEIEKSGLENSKQKNASACAKKDQQSFCENRDCLFFCPDEVNKEACQNNGEDFSKCLELTKKSDEFYKLLIDFTDDLITDAESITSGVNDLMVGREPPSLEDVSKSFEPQASDLSVFFKLDSQLFREQADIIEKSKFMQSLAGEINRVTTKISNITMTPATAIRSQFEDSISKGTAGPIEYTGEAVADAIGVFTNTLAQKLLEQLFETGFNHYISPEIAERTTPYLDPDTYSSSDKEDRDVLYSNLSVAQIKRGGEEVSIYDEFTVCPDKKKYALPNNCLLDNKLARAMEEGLTIQEAMDFKPSPLLNPGEIVGGDDGMLSLANIKKLRRYRIFPLGLEIAAEKIRNDTERDAQITLRRLVNEFNDESSDYWHLVDPNWVLKAITYKCNLRGYSAIPFANAANRKETCLDLQDCIHENDQGECDTWGYCTREKNVWRFDGDSCDPQYNTCQTYKINGQQISYLGNTLDYSNCNSNNAGCQWYCNQFNEEENNWTCNNPEDDENNVIFFNNNIKTCSEKDAGCHEYIRTSPDLGVNMLFNGSFEIDNDGDNIPDQWDTYEQGYQRIQGGYSGNSGNYGIVLESFSEEKYGISQLVGNIIAVPASGNLTMSVQSNSQEYEGGQILMSAYGIDGSKLFSCPLPNTSGWEKTSCTFLNNTPEKIGVNKVLLSAEDYVGTVILDDFKIEMGTESTSYSPYGDGGRSYFQNLEECTAEEAGCDLYTANGGEKAISGVVQNSDKCSRNCLGYDTFQEIATNFDEESRFVNLIPQAAQSCSFPGCESFTNTENEQIEYYSYLRSCVKVDTQNQAVVDNNGETLSSPDSEMCQHYYTWVSSEETGYQLKEYFLKKSEDNNSPATLYSDPNPDWGECDDKDDVMTNPHCKEFYDDEGDIYYQLYKNTITCSLDCASYRRDLDGAEQMAIAVQSDPCNKENVGCREYKGAAGDDIYHLFSDDFENGIDDRFWLDGSISNESLISYGHSLEESEEIELSVKNFVEKNSLYFISFWTKLEEEGAENISVEFSSLSEEKETKEIKNNEWHELKFGPFDFDKTPDEDGEKIIISFPGGTAYLDNFKLTKAQDNIYLIKDSWRTPCQCDTAGNHQTFHTGAKNCSEDNLAESSMTGCQLYYNSNEEDVYLKSFTSLCSEDAVGCEAMIDTQNSFYPFEQEFNKDNESENDDIVVPADNLVYLINNEENECSREDKGCQKFGNPEEFLDEKAIYYSDVYLINDPDLYQKAPILCSEEGQSCQEYEGGIYFKDPGDKVCEYRENVAIGEDKYKTGWFKKGTTQACYYENNNPYMPDGVTYGIRNNNDPKYDGWVGLCPTNQTGCTEFIDPKTVNLINNSSFEANIQGAIYRVEAESGMNYSLSASAKKINGPGKQVLKIKFLSGSNSEISSFEQEFDSEDWEKKTINKKSPAGTRYIQVETFSDSRPSSSLGEADFNWDNFSLVNLDSSDGRYYYLNNSKIDKSSCQYRVGVKDGCILFNDTSQPESTLIYDSATSYKKSEEKDDTLVNAVNAGEKTGDANIAIEVRRDRTCGEWLYCDGMRKVWDQASGSYREECEFFARCDKLIGYGDSALCGHLVDAEAEPLTEFKYINRDVSWTGMDYSGYSIYNMLPVDKLYTEETASGEGEYVLTSEKGGVGTSIYTEANRIKVDWDGDAFEWEEDEFYNSVPEEIANPRPSRDIVECPSVGDGGFYVENNNWKKLECKKGIDDNPNLWMEIRIGSAWKIEEEEELEYKELTEKTCQVYPEKDSPFSETVVKTYYPSANICVNGDNCVCSYTKADYEGQIRYYGPDSSVGKDGIPTEISYGENTKLELKEITKIKGKPGWCLEKDISQPKELGSCLTWWLGGGLGDVDLFNQYQSAGFSLGSDRYYCIASDDGILWEDIKITPKEYTGGGYNTCNYNDSTYFYSEIDDVKEFKYNLEGIPDLDEDEIEKITAKIGIDYKDDPWENNLNDICEGPEREACEEEFGEDSCKEVVWGSLNQPEPKEIELNKDNNWENTGEDTGEDVFGNSVKIKIIFDEDKLSHVELVCTDRSGEGTGNTASCGIGEITIYLKEACKKFVKIPASGGSVVKGAATQKIYDSGEDVLSKTIENDGRILEDLKEIILVNDNKKLFTTEKVYTESSLKNYFAKSGPIYEFTEQDGSWEEGTGWDRSWDRRNLEEATPPKISSAIGVDDKITIGGNDGEIIERDGYYSAVLKFYAWADDNQMPLRDIAIDWSGYSEAGWEMEYNGLYKNHKKVCGDIDNFGNTPNACEEGYFQFTKDFYCEDSDSPGWEEFSCEDEGVCCFRPRLKIRDNWSYCSPGFDGNGSDFDGSYQEDFDDCNWIYYQGIIKINPVK